METVNIIVLLFCKSFLFLYLYKIIGYCICYLKGRNMFEIPTLCKVEFLLYIILDMLFIRFASFSSCEEAS